MKTVVYGNSIRGNAHYETGLPLQDSCSYELKDNKSKFKVIAISDGHGAAPHFRSQYGSQFAVNIAKLTLTSFLTKEQKKLDRMDEISDILKTSNDAENVSKLRDELIALNTSLKEEFEKVKYEIHHEWKMAVDKDLMKHPVNVFKGQLECLVDGSIKGDSDVFLGFADVEENKIHMCNTNLKSDYLSMAFTMPRTYYGATILAVACYRDHNFLVQLGDGNTTIIDSDGSIRQAFDKDSDVVGSQVHSLCVDDSINYFHTAYEREDIKMIMLTSDGVFNGSDDPNLLSDLAQGFHDVLLEDPENLKSTIVILFRNLSANSGDDCTIGLIANDVPDDVANRFLSSNEPNEDVTELENSYSLRFPTYELDSRLYKKDASGKLVPNLSNIGRIALLEANRCMAKRIYDLGHALQLYDRFSFLGKLDEFKSSLSRAFNTYGAAYEDIRDSFGHEYAKKILEIFQGTEVYVLKYAYSTISVDKSGLNVNKEDIKYALVTKLDDVDLSIINITKEEYLNLKTNIKNQLLFVGNPVYTIKVGNNEKVTYEVLLDKDDFNFRYKK